MTPCTLWRYPPVPLHVVLTAGHRDKTFRQKSLEFIPLGVCDMTGLLAAVLTGQLELGLPALED